LTPNIVRAPLLYASAVTKASLKTSEGFVAFVHLEGGKIPHDNCPGRSSGNFRYFAARTHGGLSEKKIQTRANAMATRDGTTK
jgi:hypothetical protein